MARDSHNLQPSGSRAFTTSLGFKDPMSISSADQSSLPSHQQRPVSASPIRSLYGNFTLFLRVHSSRTLPAMAKSSYCKLYLGETPITGGFGNGKSFDKKQASSHQTFHTKVQSNATRNCFEWNEKFQINVRDPIMEVLTIRVKNHALLYSPAIGASVIHLRQLQLGETVDEWFPLFKKDKTSGQIRLQICLQETVQTPMSACRYSQVSKEMIQRLMQEHCELEEAKRRESEIQQQENWKRMEEDTVKHVAVQEHEEEWRKHCVKRIQQEQQNVDQDLISDVLPSFKNRGAMTVKNSGSDLLPSFKHHSVKMVENLDLVLPPSFKRRDVRNEEAVATQLMKKLSLQVDTEDNHELTVSSDSFDC